jgi:hypothetical protein
MTQGESPKDTGPLADNAAGLSSKPKRVDKRAKRAPTTRARKLFIDALSECGVVLYACEQSGIERRKAYWLREVDNAFALAWDAACSESTERLEREAIRRANGYDVDSVDKNGYRHTVTAYSDRLLEFMLSSRDDKFRVRRVEMTGKDGGAINVTDDAESIRSKLLHDAAVERAQDALIKADE